MGIFKRIKTITAAEVNGVLDRVEDPIAMLNQYVREMEQEIEKGQRAFARQIFIEKKQQALIIQTEELVRKRNSQARLAIEHGEDSMAKLALKEKLTHEKQLSAYREQLVAVQLQTKNLQEKLSELTGKYNELQHKRLLLSSRANVAHSIKQVQQTSNSFSAENIKIGVNRVEDRILMVESEIQAHDQYIQGQTVFSTLETIEKQASDEVETELQKLKHELKQTV